MPTVSKSLSSVTIEERNKVHSDGAWLILLKIIFSGVTLYFARNTEKIVWDQSVWQPFSFELDDIKEENKGEIPSVNIRVSNVNQQVGKYVDRGVS